MILTDKEEFDICSYDAINNYLNDTKLDYIVNCAAYTDVKNAEIKEKNQF